MEEKQFASVVLIICNKALLTAVLKASIYFLIVIIVFFVCLFKSPYFKFMRCDKNLKIAVNIIVEYAANGALGNFLF